MTVNLDEIQLRALLALHETGRPVSEVEFLRLANPTIEQLFCYWNFMYSLTYSGLITHDLHKKQVSLTDIGRGLADLGNEVLKEVSCTKAVVHVLNVASWCGNQIPKMEKDDLQITFIFEGSLGWFSVGIGLNTGSIVKSLSLNGNLGVGRMDDVFLTCEWINEMKEKVGACLV